MNILEDNGTAKATEEVKNKFLPTWKVNWFH